MRGVGEVGLRSEEAEAILRVDWLLTRGKQDAFGAF